MPKTPGSSVSNFFENTEDVEKRHKKAEEIMKVRKAPETLEIIKALTTEHTKEITDPVSKKPRTTTVRKPKGIYKNKERFIADLLPHHIEYPTGEETALPTPEKEEALRLWKQTKQDLENLEDNQKKIESNQIALQVQHKHNADAIAELKKKLGIEPTNQTGQAPIKLEQISTPSLITKHQKAIRNKRPNQKNRAGENLWEKCDELMDKPDKLQYVKNSYGDVGTRFPEILITQSIGYLQPGGMKKGNYENGKNHYGEYSALEAFEGMSEKENIPLVYKNTIDILPKEFTDALDGMYEKGYEWKTKSSQDKILSYLAEQLDLPYDPTTTDNQDVMRAYMYLLGAVSWEFLNTDYNTKEDGDKYGRDKDGKPISARVVVLCDDGYQCINRLTFDTDDCAIPLLMENG